ncbi:tRNA (N(6)-L-threonylcarbamoyladenosine(37)-C(2))-methylthiotransferase MtaB [Culicoidibacter larvae]|uniref:Threonylcarbamoyladenosine tRNA methylthiotransferase MtaB n=1 Tax=Culicoidibacter larvae TaxID=2579976 RepID=A0A5R8QEX8_9FIRM|nr:tRNA (N(6)-L-threonylcarbamoyladenosine(37)-C(2))-methylthiotransferase MtaB [Culicoidibacter larvae]TLG76565.1 tRNA (N(6)-L-threonylcarbamoyladenosine(37)-C(2))-methylthiotransferase MtaB [Culicoidibacter larvae]
MPTVAFHTLGCKVNTYETESVWNLFKNESYERVDFKSEADVYVINTCTVTNTGDRKSRQVIRRAIRRNPEAVIVVMGCYAQLKPKEIMDIEGVDIVVGTQGREKLLDYVKQYQEERQPTLAVTNIMKQTEFEALDVEGFAENTRAFLKIQEGCNNFCTFCIIPWARGLIRSRDPKNVLEQTQLLVEQGYKEVVLTGIHTAGYGEDFEEYSFADLLRDIDQNVPGLERIRISSIEASQVTDEVIEVLKNSTKIVNHLHIPLQAGSDGVLKRMKRNYLTNFYRLKIQQLREVFSDLAITTDVIVGFPGETEKEFLETYEFCKEMQFSEMHVFPYSIRNGTPAAKMENQVPELIKTARVSQLIALNDQMAKEYASSFEGSTLPVLFEEASKIDAGYYVGHTTNYLRVEVLADDSCLGQILPVKIAKAGYPLNIGTLG